MLNREAKRLFPAVGVIDTLNRRDASYDLDVKIMRVKSTDPVFPTWFLMSLGVIALVFITLFGIIRSLMPSSADSAALPAPPPAFTLPADATGPQGPVSLVPTTAPSTEAAARPPAAASGKTLPVTAPPAAGQPAPNQPPRTTPPAALVTGRYGVLATYSDSFIGEVALTNTTGRAQTWTATLTFPSNVGALVTSWVESQPQPAVRQNGRTFTWTASQPLAAGGTGQLRFHLKRTGSGDRASSCTVNGSSCR